MPTDAKPKKKKQVPLEDRRTPIDDKKKEEMLAVLIRNPNAFDAVQDLFTVSKCRKAMGDGPTVLWKVVCRFVKDYGELPGKVQIESELHNELKGNPRLLEPEEVTALDEFLTFAYDDKEHGKNIAKSKNHVRVATDTCKAVLEELLATELYSTVHKEGTVPADLQKFLQQSQSEMDLISSMTEMDLEQPFPEGWDKRKDNQLATTGVAPLDAFMGGGWRAGECLLFMAPYGSCKTTTACDSTAELVAYAATLLASGKSRLNKKGEPMIPVVVLVFTESDRDEYRNRLMAHMAKVPWKRLMDMQGIEDLSSSNKPGATQATEYENHEFAAQKLNDKDNDTWLSEQKRVRRAAKVANVHLMLIDCTDNDDNPHRVGSGGMREVANVVKGIFRKKKNHYPIAIWVDHLSGLVDRMGDTVADTDELRRALTNMPRIAVEKMGKPLGCPVGLMHQFAGNMQKQNVTSKLHHSDGEGSKSVGKYANFCVVSSKTDQNQMCVWECTKHRREPPTAQRIVKVQGDFSRLVDCSHTHGLEPGRNAIISKAEMTQAGAYHKAKSSKEFNNSDMNADM